MILTSADIFSKLEISPASNSLDLDQSRRFVVPDLGPNCLQMLAENDTSRQCVNTDFRIYDYLLKSVYVIL